MNYLAHFVVNRDWLALTRGDYFALGVCLPDLWPRYSRTRRINWRGLRAHRPATPEAAWLRLGLLNHHAIDRMFHTSRSFAAWQVEVRAKLPAAAAHSTAGSFLAHLAVELALDHRLLLERATLADEFYSSLAACDPPTVELLVSQVGGVDARGLGAVFRAFLERRFLEHYRTLAGLAEAVARVFELVSIAPPEPALLERILERACTVVEPNVTFHELACSYSADSERCVHE